MITRDEIERGIGVKGYVLSGEREKQQLIWDKKLVGNAWYEHFGGVNYMFTNLSVFSKKGDDDVCIQKESTIH